MILLFWRRRTQHLAGMQDSADKQRDRRFVRDRSFLWGSLAPSIAVAEWTLAGQCKDYKRKTRRRKRNCMDFRLACRGPSKSFGCLKCSFERYLGRRQSSQQKRNLRRSTYEYLFGTNERSSPPPPSPSVSENFIWPRLWMKKFHCKKGNAFHVVQILQIESTNLSEPRRE